MPHARYHVGCAGQSALDHQPLHHYTDDRNEAIAACLTGPVGCEVLDTETGEWIGPTCWEELSAAHHRLMQRAGERGDMDAVERHAAAQTDIEVRRMGSLARVAGVPEGSEEP